MNKKALFLVGFLLFGLAAVYLVSETKETPLGKATVGLAAPSFELKDTNGKVWRLSDFKGRVVIVNFWATWCDSCKSENPSLQRFFGAEREADRCIVLTVLFKDKPAEAVAYMKANSFSFPVLIDDRDLAVEFGITGVPETFVIDKDGKLVDKMIGPFDWDAAPFRAAVQRIVARS